jgi:hypothetical protein
LLRVLRVIDPSAGRPWQPFALAGVQDCFACRFTGGPAELRYAGATARLGATNLFVPADDCVFVTPSLIAHYIDAHDYAPPAEFQQAVMNCPAMRSVAYLKMLRKHGLHRLAARDIARRNLHGRI